MPHLVHHVVVRGARPGRGLRTFRGCSSVSPMPCMARVTAMVSAGAVRGVALVRRVASPHLRVTDMPRQ
jgi:hypothetical protein